MEYRLEIQEEALSEISNAYDWYEDQRIGLGTEFIDEIEDCLSSITEYPERYGYVRNSNIFRRIRVSRFPYMIVYEIGDDTVTVNSVVHFKQDKKF